MASIPQYAGQQVRSQGIGSNGFSMRAPDASGLTRGLAQVENDLMQRMEQERESADTAEVVSAKQQMDEWKLKTMFDPEAGVYTRKGRNALDVTNQTLGAYDAQSQKILEGISNERVKTRLKTLFVSDRTSLNEELNKYEYGENKRYQNETDDALIKTSQQAATLYYNQPDKVAFNQRQAAAVIQSKAQRNGWSPEKTNLELLNSSSDIHSAILGRMMNDDPYQAREYFKSAQSGMTAEAQRRAQSQINGEISRREERAQRQAEIREMKALRVLDQMDRQASTGIPPSQAEQQRWQAALAGTSMADEYGDRMEQMDAVQQVLRLPLTDQQAYMQQVRQQLAIHGGSVAQVANLDRMERAVTANMQRMREQPLEWNAMRTGAAVEPLDFSVITADDGQAALSEQIASRFDTVNAVRNQLGAEINRNPFLPQEVATLKSALASMGDGGKLRLLGAIAQASSNGSEFAGALQVIAADDPPLMLAGLAQANQLKGDDGTDVPSVLLAGSKVLADKSTPMPSEQKLRTAFDESIGQAIPSGTQEREHAYTAFKYLYAGLAGPEGVQDDGSADEVDDELAQKAVKLSTGGVIERAGTKVIKPYGWDDDRFDDAVDSQLTGLAEGSGIPVGQLEELPLLPVPGVQGSYYLLNGGRPQLDPKSNQPMVVKLQ